MQQIHKKLLLVYSHLPLSPRYARHFPPSSGEAYTKEERIHIFYFYIYSFDDILCRILRYESYVFFLPSTFRFCPPLKNDGRSELRYGVTINDFFIRRKEYEMKAVPAHGEGVNRQVDGRGKSEQTRK